MKSKVLFIIVSLCFNLPGLSEEFKANRELRRELESFLEGRMLEFPPSRGFDMFYELSAGEVTVSISKEEWLPSPKPLTALKLKSIRIRDSHQLIPFSKTFPDPKQLKTSPMVQRRFSNSSSLRVEYFEIEMEHEIHGEFKVIISPLEKVSSKEELFQCLETYFKRTPGNQWLQTEKDGLIHFQHCGHLFGATEPTDWNNNEGKFCSLCFREFPKPSNFRLDFMLSERLKSEIKIKSDIITHGEEHDIIQDCFQKVLHQFPSNLLGFDYKCYVLDHSSLGVSTTGAGQVFVTNGTLNQLRDLDYLELILTHELAHSELRHVALEVIRMQKNAESIETAQQILNAMAMLSEQVSPSEGQQYFAASLQAMGSMIEYANYIGMESAQELFSQKSSVEADILMYAYAKKNGIQIAKATQLLKIMRSVESSKLRGFDGEDGFESHLPLRHRITQSQNHEIYFHDRLLNLSKAGQEVGTARLLFSGYIDHEKSTNERYLNFMLFQIETNEFAPSNTLIEEIIAGFSIFKCLQQSMKLSYFDTQNYLFVSFDDKPLRENPVIRKFSGFELGEDQE